METINASCLDQTTSLEHTTGLDQKRGLNQNRGPGPAAAAAGSHAVSSGSRHGLPMRKTSPKRAGSAWRAFSAPGSSKALLLRRCLGPEAEDEDWSRLYDLFDGAIRNIASVTLRAAGCDPDVDEIDELCQDVYLRWLRGQSGFDGWDDGSFWRFIQASVRHALVDKQRYLGARKRRPRKVSSIFGWRPNGPHEALLRRERRRFLIRHCFRASVEEGAEVESDRYSRALALGWVVLGGCTSAEAGRRYGLEQKSVDQMIRRLRRNMSRDGLSLPHRSTV